MKSGEVRCFSWPIMAGHGRERERDINGGSWWKCVENVGKLEKLVACGGRKGFKEKEKRKRN